jgi:hypothetical protein
MADYPCRSSLARCLPRRGAAGARFAYMKVSNVVKGAVE